MIEQSKIQNIQNRKLAGIVVLIVAFLVGGAEGLAQQSTKIPRVGILFIGGRDQPHLESFKEGLREHGYSEGKNITLEYRYAEGDYTRLADFANEFVREKLDIIIATSSYTALVVRKATRTIPIVMTSGNPLQPGLAESLAKPGGNVTGLSILLTELNGKRVELLKEAFPKVNRIAALWTELFSEAAIGLKETQEAAQALGLKVHPLQIQAREDIEKAFAEFPKARVNALVVVLSPATTLYSKLIVDRALKQRIPGVYPTRQFAEEGGLMAYGPLVGDLYRRAGTYVDKILKGAKPAELPIEQPTKFELLINLKTAKQIGLTIPPNVLARADRVIK
jgi:putative ABC transport system substrate-binding protein